MQLVNLPSLSFGHVGHRSSLRALLFEELKEDKNKVKIFLMEVIALVIATITGYPTHARG